MNATIRTLEWFAGVDGLLRGRLPTGDAGARVFWRQVACAVVFGGLYGAVMGTFTGLSPDHRVQLVYSATKVPLLLLACFALSVPSFFVLNSLFGLRDDFGQALRALAATQAGLTVILASLSPFTAVWYLTSGEYSSAVSFNGLMFLTASGSAQILLRRFYGPLIARNARHRWLLAAWLVVYAFVAIQMAWVLRPFIGDPLQPPQFLRPDVFSENAYQVVLRLGWVM
ncbi:MAG: hypothetical protein SH850_23115, partial [Planctomycetaceae bacterium]|nr:hypothetical protein [Planctomycetaceae bacterium]